MANISTAHRKPPQTKSIAKRRVTAGVRKTGKQAVDPITFSVVLNRFNTIANEMTLTMEKTSWTSIIALARDFSCAIYDAKARQICMMDALPVHTNSMHVVLREIARVFEDDIHDGDVIVCNDPYSGNTHVGDFVTACPVFHKGKHMFWSMTKGHQLDCGAFIPTSTPAAAKDVWQEGLQLPPIKFYEKGKRRDDVVRIYLANVRWQEWLYGDLMAQLGSIWTGKRRLIELAAHYGNDTVERYIEAIFDYADQRMAEEIRQMPDGDYEGISWLDTDGQGGTDIPVKARVSIRDDRVHVDFTGSAPQTPGANNSSFGVMQAAAGIPILCTIDPSIPHNDGCLRHITAEAPLGSVCNAQYPASTALATIGPDDTMQDAVYKALAHAVPERVTGGHGRVHCVPFFSGTDTRDEQERHWGCMFFNGGPAGGASSVQDGLASHHHLGRHGRAQDPERGDERDALPHAHRPAGDRRRFHGAWRIITAAPASRSRSRRPAARWSATFSATARPIRLTACWVARPRSAAATTRRISKPESAPIAPRRGGSSSRRTRSGWAIPAVAAVTAIP